MYIDEYRQVEGSTGKESILLKAIFKAFEHWTVVRTQNRIYPGKRNSDEVSREVHCLADISRLTYKAMKYYKGEMESLIITESKSTSLESQEDSINIDADDIAEAMASYLPG